MFQPQRQRMMWKVAAAAACVLGALPAHASMVCSWNLEASAERSPEAFGVAVALRKCDVIALQGVDGPALPDGIQMSLSRMGGDWGQLPPQPGAPDKAFLFNQEAVSYAGRMDVYDGYGLGYSARFNPVDGRPFVLASISGRPSAEGPYDLSSFLGHLSEAFPEDGRNWIIAGQMGTHANDESLASFRRSAKPLVHSVDTELPSLGLETMGDGIRVLARTERPGESQDQIWVAIGSKVDVREAGAIDYLAAIEASGGRKPSLEEAKAHISPYLPVYAIVGSGERIVTDKPPVLIPTMKSRGAPQFINYRSY